VLSGPRPPTALAGGVFKAESNWLARTRGATDGGHVQQEPLGSVKIHLG